MTIVLFEDQHVARLNPICLTRPAFEITCGGYQLFERLSGLHELIFASVRPHLRAVTSAVSVQNAGDVTASRGTPSLWVNARLTPSSENIEQLRLLRADGRPGVVRQPGAAQMPAICAAIVPAEATQQIASAADPAAALAALGLPKREGKFTLLDYPHDVIREHLATLAANLQHRVAAGEYQQLADGVFAAPGAQLAQYVVTDTSQGPIVLESGAQVGPHAYLRGPLHVGASARVIEHASIKDGVTIGTSSKVGGEVEASIIEAYTNKQHHGFLGHSYLGSWINLGAGTSNSDLKNSYGTVTVDCGGQKVSTGMQFFGTAIGDFTKTAINTSIFTGKLIGACSMVYGYVTTNVPSFVNYARSFGQMSEASVGALAATQQRMFERRFRAQSSADVQLLAEVFELTRGERAALGELSRGPLTL